MLSACGFVCTRATKEEVCTKVTCGVTDIEMFSMMKTKAALPALLIFCTGILVGLLCAFFCGRKVYMRVVITRDVGIQSQTTYRKASIYKADQFSCENHAVSRCVVLDESDHGVWPCG